MVDLRGGVGGSGRELLSLFAQIKDQGLEGRATGLLLMEERAQTNGDEREKGKVEEDCRRPPSSKQPSSSRAAP